MLSPAAPALARASPSRLTVSALSASGLARGVDMALWHAGELARSSPPGLSTGWPALDAELPGGGWPPAGLTELLLEAASCELSLLAPWLHALGQRALGPRELLWIAPPHWPCVAALQGQGLALPRLVCVTPASAADGAWAAEQALRAGHHAAVLWWSTRPMAGSTWRRLHLAAQGGNTPLMALRPPAARALSSPAPLRLACTPQAGRQLAVEVFKRRGPPMAGPLTLSLPWPVSARHRRAQITTTGATDAVDRPLPAAIAAASPALVTARA